jgi:hypothetical protein
MPVLVVPTYKEVDKTVMEEHKVGFQNTYSCCTCILHVYFIQVQHLSKAMRLKFLV